MKKIIINICFILIALTAVASVCACDANNCTEEVDLSGNNVENIAVDEITVNSTADEEGANWTDVNGSTVDDGRAVNSSTVDYGRAVNGSTVDYDRDGRAVEWVPPINIPPCGGNIVFCFELDNIDGCQWVVSECSGVELVSEYISDFDGKLHSTYIVTEDDAIVKFDLINSNGEVIDTRVKCWGNFFGYNL